MNFYTAHNVVFLTSAVLAQWRGVPPYKESSAWSWFGSALRISSTQLRDEHEIKTTTFNMYYSLHYSLEQSHITDRLFLETGQKGEAEKLFPFSVIFSIVQ